MVYLLQQGPYKSKSELYIKISFIKYIIPSIVKMEQGAAVPPAGAMWKWLLLQCLLNGTSEKLIRQTLEEAVFCKLLGGGGQTSSVVRTNTDLRWLRSEGTTLGCT